MGHLGQLETDLYQSGKQSFSHHRREDSVYARVFHHFESNIIGSFCQCYKSTRCNMGAFGPAKASISKTSVFTAIVPHLDQPIAGLICQSRIRLQLQGVTRASQMINHPPNQPCHRLLMTNSHDHKSVQLVYVLKF